MTDAIEQMRQYVRDGVRFRHQGRNPATGLDCVGLVRLYLLARGYVFADRSDYDRDPDGSLEKELVRVIGEPVALGKCGHLSIPGDVVAYRFSAVRPRHVAIVTTFAGLPHVLHADTARRKVVEHPLDDRWRNGIVGVWRPE